MWQHGSVGPSARYVMTDRTGGISLPPYDSSNLGDHVGDEARHVDHNRAALLAAARVAPGRMVSMAPVHGREVAVVSNSDLASARPIAGVDALVTLQPDLGLLVVAADCVPVILADGRAGVVAVAHAGWAGVLSDVVGATISVMVEQGARVEHMHAVLGPAICGLCYAVPRERFDAVVARAPGSASIARDGGPGLDLRAAVVQRLRSMDVAVELFSGCTFECPEFFSHRRDGRTGRHGSVVVLESR